MVRKHIKVEPQRWFYHADRLGLLVWQDMPSLTAQDVDPDRRAAGAVRGRAATRSSTSTAARPSVVAYVAVQRGLGRVGAPTPGGSRRRSRTRTRPGWSTRTVATTAASRWATPATATSIDWHIYVGPASPPPTRPGSRSRRVRRAGPAHAGPQVARAQRPGATSWQPNSTALTDRYVGWSPAGVLDLMFGAGLSAVDLHRDHRPGGRAQRLPHLRPAGGEDGPGPGPRGQPGSHPWRADGGGRRVALPRPGTPGLVGAHAYTFDEAAAPMADDAVGDVRRNLIGSQPTWTPQGPPSAPRLQRHGPVVDTGAQVLDTAGTTRSRLGRSSTGRRRLPDRCQPGHRQGQRLLPAVLRPGTALGVELAGLRALCPAQAANGQLVPPHRCP